LNQLSTIALVAITACTTNHSGGPSGDNGKADGFGSSPIDSGCSGALFDHHPHTGTARLPGGVVVNTPLWVCGANSTVVYGVVDYDVVAGLAAGTGYSAYSTVVDGQKKGVVRFNMYHAGGADVGPYSSAIVSFEASQGAEKAFPWVNAYSALVPSVDPDDAVFVYRIHLNSVIARDYGIKLLGLDKRSAIDEYQFATLGTTEVAAFYVSDELPTSQPLIRSLIEFDESPAAQGAAAGGLASALGLATLPPGPPETVSAYASIDPSQPNTLAKSTAYVNWSSPYHAPLFNAFDPAVDRFELNPDTEVGGVLSSFQPKAIAHDDNVDVVLGLDERVPL
jgi:hypothetical protein